MVVDLVSVPGGQTKTCSEKERSLPSCLLATYQSARRSSVSPRSGIISTSKKWGPRRAGPHMERPAALQLVGSPVRFCRSFTKRGRLGGSLYRGPIRGQRYFGHFDLPTPPEARPCPRPRRRRSLWIYERNLALLAGVLPRHDLQGSLDALRLYRHTETRRSIAHLNRDPYHLCTPLSPREIAMFVTHELYFMILTDSSEEMPQREDK